MAQITADFETGTHGDLLTTGDTGSATAFENFGETPVHWTYDNTRPLFGTLAGKCQQSVSTATWNWDAAVDAQANPVISYGRMYLNFGALIGGGDPGQWLFIGDGGAGTPHGAYVLGNNQISCRSGGTTVTSAIAYPLNQWIRIEWYINCNTAATGGGCELRLWLDPHSTDSPTETLWARNDGGFALQKITFGLIRSDTGGGSAGPLYYDSIVACATNWVGPVVASTSVVKPNKTTLRDQPHVGKMLANRA